MIGKKLVDVNFRSVDKNPRIIAPDGGRLCVPAAALFGLTSFDKMGPV